MFMTSNFKKYKFLVILLVVFYASNCFSQAETSQWKFQIAFGVNNPVDNDDSDNYYSKYINFPTINLGVQRMFTPKIGAKLDFGYNRSVSDDDSDDFKFNYTRINAQFVYDFKYALNFLPSQMTIVGHVGPGISFTKPLGNFSDNKYTFLNGLGGLEVHYGLSRTVSVYGDLSYVLALSGKDKYDAAVDGFSFNGDLMYVTVGISVSLSGCYFCD